MAYRQAIEKEKETLDHFNTFPDECAHNPVLYEQKKAAYSAYKAAEASVKKLKKGFDTYVAKDKTNPRGFHARFEHILRTLDIKREHYHGGKFNGVMCARIAKSAKEIMDSIKEELKKRKADSVSDACIDNGCDKFQAVLQNQNEIWSRVRGIDGLLPTEEHLKELKEAIETGKKLWKQVGLSTKQPKWHYTFYLQHLYAMVVKFGGIADKTDEYIEKDHQYWKVREARFCRITSFKTQQLAMRRAERRSRHPQVEIASIMMMRQAIRQQSANSNRKRQSLAKAAIKKQLKEEILKEYRIKK